MRVEWRVALSAVLWALLAGLLGGPIRFVLIWISACMVVVAISIRQRSPALLGKRPDGSIPAWSYLIFWPWHAVTQLKVRWHRRSSPPVVTEVRPGLFLGGWPADGDVPEDCAIVDLTSELPRRVRGRDYRCWPTWDSTESSAADFDAAVVYVAAELAAGRSVLVHCAHGRGRSTCVLAAAMVANREAVDTAEAWAKIAARRQVRASVAQRVALARWEARRG